MVGTLGFAISLGLLTFLSDVMHLPEVVAYIIASEISLFNNFLLHHHWTYKRKNISKSITTLLVQFHATSWVALVGGTAIFTFGVHVLHLNKFMALVLSSAIALLWNFSWSKYVIWHSKAQKPPHDKLHPHPKTNESA
jgi:putative flippase GtrA